MPARFLAAIGAVCFIIAMILKLVDKDPRTQIWLIMIGGLLACVAIFTGFWGPWRSTPSGV